MHPPLHSLFPLLSVLLPQFPLRLFLTPAKLQTMKRRTLLQSIPAAVLLPTTTWTSSAQDKSMNPQNSSTVYELRIYHAAEGKLQDLLKRFREHTLKLFANHGMKTLAFWVPTDEPAHSNMLVYILEHPSREAATTNWKSFQNDPEWLKVKSESERNGSLVDKVDSTYMSLTEFSPQFVNK